MYKEFKRLNLPEIDREILAHWEKGGIFERSVQERDAKNSFVFYEGPPSANGLPGIHHVMARAIKDVFCRFQTLQGKRVERKGGWDTHGLPIELSVEKELGITKEDIGTKISVDDYNQACRKTVMRYKDVWDNITKKMGYWVDLEQPYITYENNYIESVWWLLKQIYDKDLLYKGYTIQPYSPAAGTGLSSHELNMPGAYQEVSDTSAVAIFTTLRNAQSEWLHTLPLMPPPSETEEAEVQLLGSADSEKVGILAWTTTPWTLPSNTALTVGPKLDYVKVRTENPYIEGQIIDVVLAEKLLEKWFGGKRQPKILGISQPFKGEQLLGIRYEQLLDMGVPEEGDAFVVISGDFVTTEDGTGIVHTAPSFGADDMRVGKANGIGALTLVDKAGKFTEHAGEFAGRYVKNYKDEADYVDVNVDIAVRLKLDGKAFNVAKYVHNYPHCWRTDKPILYYPLDSWFIKASAVKERMSALNQTINWKPASTGEGRFGKWLENLQDWNLSRSRYWGIPLPIWRSEDQTEEVCIGSLAELQSAIDEANAALGLQQSVPADLHRPYIDEIVLFKNGKKLLRELDLIDVWFDSGSMPYAQWHYPFENKAVFERNFPADFIAEGVDQTRGWFYTLHAIGTMVFDSVAFKNVVSNGLVLDKNGKKMSKRLGNAVDPFTTIDAFGADATRWYMLGASDPWDNLKFDEEGIKEVQRRFFGTLYNTYGFYALYANIDQYAPEKSESIPHDQLAEIDRWISSRLNSLTKDVSGYYADYEATKAIRAIDLFVNEELSNWYVRQNRRRFWKGEMTADKQAAYQTLYTCLERVAQLMSPVAPFFADWLYLNLTRGTAHDSVHLSLLPAADESLIDSELEKRMSYAQRLSSLALSLRKGEKIRVRQPLSSIVLPCPDGDFKQRVEAIQDILLAEVNVKKLTFLTDDDFLRKQIKPNFRTLGKRLGKDMKAAAAAITSMSDEDTKRIEQEGRFQLSIASGSVEILLEDVEITTQDIPGWKVATDNELTLALDVAITDELYTEGMARELINRIQLARKQAELEVTDRIQLRLYSEDAAVAKALEVHHDYIASEVLADHLDFQARSAEGLVTELVDGATVVIEF